MMNRDNIHNANTDEPQPSRKSGSSTDQRRAIALLRPPHKAAMHFECQGQLSDNRESRDKSGCNASPEPRTPLCDLRQN